MLINNVKLINGVTVNICIAGNKINSISQFQNNNDPFELHFENAIAFPGLINSHDHLDFNLFPQLGNKIYSNYTEWGNYIHKNYQFEIDQVLKIPEPLRTSWGMYKNLLCGVTTVVNHGKKLAITDPLITVIRAIQSLHSVGFEKFWKLKLNNPLKKKVPCVIHTGEGTDKQSEQEIDELVKWNLLKRELIGIHGVAMNETQAKKFDALVWCPASNYFLFNKTSQINILKQHTQICFGTDSTLTSCWNIWEHIRMAKSCNLVNETELFEMLTSIPANVWKLNSGILEEGKDADIVVAKTKNNSNLFYSINPQDILLVMHQGNIRLFDEEVKPEIEKFNFNMTDFFKIEISKSIKYVQGNLPELLLVIKSYYPGVILPINILND